MQGTRHHCSAHQDPSHRWKRHQDPRPGCSICSPCLGSFGNENRKNRGCHPYSVRQHETQGWSSWSSSVSETPWSWNPDVFVSESKISLLQQRCQRTLYGSRVDSGEAANAVVVVNKYAKNGILAWSSKLSRDYYYDSSAAAYDGAGDDVAYSHDGKSIPRNFDHLRPHKTFLLVSGRSTFL